MKNITYRVTEDYVWNLTIPPLQFAFLPLALLLVLLQLHRRKQHHHTDPHATSPALQRKKEFLRRVGDDYGYESTPAGFVDTWRAHELPQLIHPIQDRSTDSSSENEVYLDYAGAALPVASQLEAIRIDSTYSILANPHSTGPAASRTLYRIEQARSRIIQHFHADNRYDLVFTSGATEALRIVAERFPWTNQSILTYAPNVHTSVVGMRGPALRQGASFECMSVEQLLQDNANTKIFDRKLLVLSMECNFGGDRLDCEGIIAQVRSESPASCYVMLDIAKAAATGPVDLCSIDPDFACVSFYKIFGEPTGLGALFVKRAAIPTLMGSSREEPIRHYFGGGSVDAVLPRQDFGVLRSKPTALTSLSNGTIHFRGISSLLVGFRELDRLGGMERIQKHSQALASELSRRLRSVRHCNGRPVVVIYGAWGSSIFTSDRFSGPTLSFNLLREDGEFVGYNEVSKLAALNRPPIQLRSGCFCNPGACQEALGLTDDDVKSNYETAGHVCGDQIDLVNDKPTGAIRASFGKDSIWEDLDALVMFIQKIYVSNLLPDVRRSRTVATPLEVPSRVVVSELCIFPIKSCHGQRVKRWKLGFPNGRLAYDREFALIGSTGETMRLQTFPRMSYVHPVVDLEKGTLTVSAPDVEPLILNLTNESTGGDESEKVVKICGNNCAGIRWGSSEASDWFSCYLGVRCWLARYSSSGDYDLPKTSSSRGSPVRGRHLAFTNDQPLLLISESAVNSLNTVLRRNKEGTVSYGHFRPNLVVRSNISFSSLTHPEDMWSHLKLEGKDVQLDVLGPCARCSMVDVDPSTGMKGKTLRALAEYRRDKGTINFGVFLRMTPSSFQISEREVYIGEGDDMIATR